MTRITIIGSGFAGLTTIRELRRQGGDAERGADAERGVDAEIVVVSPHDSLTCLPGLIWVPPGLRREADLPAPLAGFFARHRVARHQGTVQFVADGERWQGSPGQCFPVDTRSCVHRAGKNERMAEGGP